MKSTSYWEKGEKKVWFANDVVKQNAKFRKQRIYKHYAKTKDQNIEEINMKDNDNENKEQIEKRK